MSIGKIYFIKDIHGNFIGYSSLPIGEYETRNVRKFYYKGNKPITIKPGEIISNLGKWKKKFIDDGYEFSKYMFPIPKKDNSFPNKCIAVIPVANLEIAEDPPIGGKWNIGGSVLMSFDMAKTQFDLSKFERYLEKGEKYSFWTKQYDNGMEDIKVAFFDAREDLWVLMASGSFCYGRDSSRFCAIKGYPLFIYRDLYIFDQTTQNNYGHHNNDGSFWSWKLNNDYIDSATRFGLINVFTAINDESLDDEWRLQIKRSASFIGRSLSAVDRIDALLNNVIALETMLTRKDERNFLKLSSRISGLSGWHLKKVRPKFKKEIKHIFDTRHDIVHNADYSKLTNELLWQSDHYAQNCLANIVILCKQYKSKDSLISFLDSNHESQSWSKESGLGWVDDEYSNQFDKMYLW